MNLHFLKCAQIKFLISLIIFVIFAPFVAVILLISGIYRKTVETLLKIEYGPKFRGLLNGADMVHAISAQSPITTILLILQFDQDSSKKSLYETITELITKTIFKTDDQRYLIFKSTIKKSMGYCFRVDSNIQPEDCLKEMKRIDSKENKLNYEELMNLITDYYNSSLPKNNTILWEMLVGSQEIQWSSCKGINSMNGKFYPLLFRIHHSVTDGVSLLKFFTGVLADHPSVRVVLPEKALKAPQNQRGRIGKFIKKIALDVYCLISIPALIFEEFVLKCRDSNVINGPPLTGRKLVAMEVEKGDEYVRKIKKIKSKVPGASFMDVLLTAYSASIQDYFQQNSVFRPKYITSVIPVLPGSSEIQYLIPGELKDECVNFGNSFSLVTPRLPIFIGNPNRSDSTLLERLELVRKETDRAKNFVEYQVNRWILNTVFSILPYFMVKFVMNVHCSTVISILAGPSRMSLQEGVISVENIAFWIPHLENTGLALAGVTFNRRLHLGFSSDRALISNRRIAQEVLKNVFRYLDVFESETENL